MSQMETGSPGYALCHKVIKKLQFFLSCFSGLATPSDVSSGVWKRETGRWGVTGFHLRTCLRRCPHSHYLCPVGYT